MSKQLCNSELCLLGCTIVTSKLALYNHLGQARQQLASFSDGCTTATVSQNILPCTHPPNKMDGSLLRREDLPRMAGLIQQIPPHTCASARSWILPRPATIAWFPLMGSVPKNPLNVASSNFCCCCCCCRRRCARRTATQYLNTNS